MSVQPTKLTLRARIRAFISLPGRVISLEEKTVNLNDRLEPIEGRVLSYLDKMREELTEMKVLLRSQAEQDIETTALMGSLIRDMKDQIDAVCNATDQNSAKPKDQPQSDNKALHNKL